MKFTNYLIEGKIKQALALDEPEVGKDYAPEKIKRYLAIIDAALAEMKSKKEDDSNDAVVEDLRDKRSKWKNVKSETKPTKTKQEEPPPEEEEPPPEEEPQPNKAPATKEEPPPEPEEQKESKLIMALKKI